MPENCPASQAIVPNVKPALVLRPDSAALDSQLEILRRICDRGLVYGLEQKHTHVVDLFQHMKDEVSRLRIMLGIPE